MIKFELALEILHTRSETAQDSHKKATKHLEKETIKVAINSKSIQLKTKKNSSTGLTDALASVHPTLGGRTDALPVYLFWMQAEIKSTYSIAPVELTVPSKSSV